MPACGSPTLLARLLEDPLVVVDVGARYGFAQAWTGLGDRCMTYGFEPDEEECTRLTEQHRSQPQMKFVPFALGAKRGLATLYLTVDRKGCSVYPPAPDAVNRHPGLITGKLDSTTIIDMITLDEWRAMEGVAKVDVIKVDTQGSELDVLMGAEETLKGVRAIDVEVEFNELYEGIPLFGDVDRYLRSQGFVLWRLRDFAHYGLYGARSDIRTRDTAYYDEYAAPFSPGSGQLFWANAFYVKRAVCHPEESNDWQQLVRDACITSANEVFDLSRLALERARTLAPEEVRAELDVALSWELQRARLEWDLAQRSDALRGTFKFDLGDPAFVGGGWGPVQVLPYAKIRWTGPGRDAWIDLPVILPPGTRVEFLVVAAMCLAIF